MKIENIRQIKGKRRVEARTYRNGNTLYSLQIYERNLKRWVTVAVTTNKAFAQQWDSKEPITCTVSN